MREREAAIAMRDEIMGVVAHDLRTPLSAIVMGASLVKARAGDDAVPPVETIERAAHRMNRLIQDLLDVTRIEAGHLTIEPSRVSTRQIILDSVEAHRAQVASASLEIEVQLASGVADVHAEPDRLIQVLENLIGNAVKFSRRAGRITVGARTSDKEVLFWVRDAGIGIAADQLPHIFDRFWQAQTKRQRGVGLGLSIVKGIVDAHGGRVWAESTLGQGTTFFFTIPAA
jgi:signal transduction histidine kinase